MKLKITSNYCLGIELSGDEGSEHQTVVMESVIRDMCHGRYVIFEREDSNPLTTPIPWIHQTLVSMDTQ